MRPPPIGDGRTLAATSISDSRKNGEISTTSYGGAGERERPDRLRPRRRSPGRVPPKPQGGPKPPPAGDAKKTAFKPTLYKWRDPSLIPPREFVYGRHYARKYLSATVAPSGIGKTSLTIVNVMAMVSGRNLIGDKPHRPMRVWYWNGEDPREEIERRIAATCIHYKIGPEDIEDRLFFNSGRDTEIIIASQTKSGALIATPIENALTEAMIDGKIRRPRFSIRSSQRTASAKTTIWPSTRWRKRSGASPRTQIAQSNSSTTFAKQTAQKSPRKMAAAPAPWSPPHDQSASSTTCRRMRLEKPG